MSVGLAVTKQEIDSRSGDLARSFQRIFDQVEILKFYTDATPDPTLVALGYTAAEVASLKSAVADMHQLFTIYNGNATLAVAKDFKVFIKVLWGLGAF